MPLYSFTVVDTKTGEVVHRFDVPLAVAERDNLQLRRSSLPERLAISGSAQNPHEGGNEYMRAVRNYELRHGTTAFRRNVGYDPVTVKMAAALPAPSEP